jgi:cathepsin L
MCRLVLSLYALSLTVSWASRETSVSNEAYDSFRVKHDLDRERPLHEDTVGYAGRAALFEQRRAEVEALNARPGASWKAGLTRFADYTKDEFGALLGYRRLGRRGDGAFVSSFLQSQPNKRVVTESMDWRTRLNNSATFQRDQGSCGSCWAVAAVGALEMHAELRGGPTHKLSFEQLVDCVPNPKHCGGEGGCKGATSELAFEYVQGNGLAGADDYKGYMSGGDGKCKPPSKQSTVTDGFERLPENNYQAVYETLATKGPVVVSIAADGWSLYESGIFDTCQKDTVVNHAVVAVGFGHDTEKNMDYWLIRNSWGETWGEKGYIRLMRHTSDQGDAGYCGTDNNPKEGVGCDDGPKSIPVCGMCGVLSDVSYPKNVRIAITA